MKSIARTLLMILVTVLFLGCDGNEEYTINPDGSARIVLSWDEGITVGDMVKHSQGVDAWSGLKAKVEDGEVAGKTITAYVPDITNYRINGSPGPPMRFRKKDGGGFELESRPKLDQPKQELTGAELDAALEKIRNSLAMQKTMMGRRISGDGKSSVTLQTATKPVTSPHFKETADGRYRMSFNAKKSLEVTGAIEKDDSRMRALARYGEREFRNAMRQAVSLEVFGTGDDPSFAFPADGSALFDYDAEVRTAKQNERDMLLQSGLFRTALPPDPEQNPIESVKLWGATTRGDSRGRQAAEVRFRVRIASNVVDIPSAEIVSATGAEGTECFPALGFSREGMVFHREGEQETEVLLSLKLPPSGKFQKLSCALLVGTGSKPVVTEIGKTDLKEPFEAAGLWARMDTAKMGPGTHATISFTYDSKAPFTILKFIDDNGDVHVNRRLNGAKTHRGSHGFLLEGEISGGRWEVTTYGDFAPVEVPIELADVLLEKQ